MSGADREQGAGDGRAPSPSVDRKAFVHPLAFVFGDVLIAAGASVWPFAVLRGDNERISVGPMSNVQDAAVLHADPGTPALIGARVTVGHRAVVHGAVVEDDCLIGIGAILLNGAVIGTGSIVGAGALVPEGMVVPPGSLVLGVPGRVVRATSDVERERMQRTVDAYLRLQRRHAAGDVPGA